MDTALSWVVDKTLDEFLNVAPEFTSGVSRYLNLRGNSSEVEGETKESASKRSCTHRVASSTDPVINDAASDTSTPSAVRSQALLPPSQWESYLNSDMPTQDMAHDNEILFSLYVHGEGVPLGVINLTADSCSRTLEVSRLKLQKLLVQKYPQWNNFLGQVSRDGFSITMMYNKDNADCDYELRNNGSHNPVWVNNYKPSTFLGPKQKRLIRNGMTIIVIPPQRSGATGAKPVKNAQPLLSFLFAVPDV